MPVARLPVSPLSWWPAFSTSAPLRDRAADRFRSGPSAAEPANNELYAQHQIRTLSGQSLRALRYENTRFKASNRIPVEKSKTLKPTPMDSMAFICRSASSCSGRPRPNIVMAVWY